MSSSANFANPSWINKQLMSYGARTSGSLEQRQERLHRFMVNEEKKALATPKKKSSTVKVAPGAPRKAAGGFGSRADDAATYMTSEQRAVRAIIPSILMDGAANEYEELRILAEAAGMLEDEADDEKDSDYEPSDEEEDDDMSLAHTAELDEEDSLETAITDTWNIYLQTKSSQALEELIELVDQLDDLRSTA